MTRGSDIEAFVSEIDRTIREGDVELESRQARAQSLRAPASLIVPKVIGSVTAAA